MNRPNILAIQGSYRDVPGKQGDLLDAVFTSEEIPPVRRIHIRLANGDQHTLERLAYHPSEEDEGSKTWPEVDRRGSDDRRHREGRRRSDVRLASWDQDRPELHIPSFEHPEAEEAERPMSPPNPGMDHTEPFLPSNHQPGEAVPLEDGDEIPLHESDKV